MSVDFDPEHREVEEAFDGQARAVYECRAFSDKDKIWRILNYAGLEKSYRVIDVGCGPGHILRELRGHVCEIVGLDISYLMLEMAKQQAPEAEVVHGLAEEIPFPDNSFDLVLSRAAIHHVRDARAAFREMARICKPDCYVVIAETLTSPEKSKADLHNYIEKLRDPSHNRMLDLEEYHRLFEEACLQLVDKFRTEDERELEEWLNVTSPPPETRVYIRNLLEQNIENDNTGLKPFRNGGTIRLKHVGTTFKALKK